MIAILFERVFMESVLNFLTNINVIFTLLGYLIGGIPFGYALMKIFYGMDITKIGSGGIGATNVLRALQSKGVSNAKQMALLVLILDLFKGMFAVFLSKLFGLDYSLQWMVAIASILGHCYSPFLNFNGGKGVSTIMGSVVLLIPIESLIGLTVWFFVGKVLKISSLASILGVGTATVLIFFVPYMHIPDSVNILKEVGTQTPMVLILFYPYQACRQYFQFIDRQRKESLMKTKQGVHIHNLVFETILGILEFERLKPQKISVNVDLFYTELPNKAYLDYMEIQEIIQNTMREKQYLLIEDALKDLSQILKTRYSGISELYLKISKLEISPNSQVGASVKICYESNL